MTDDRKQALQELSDIGQQMEQFQKEYKAENDAWWDGLTEKEREDAFYAVVKRTHKAEIQDEGTYRYALYEVFGFDGGMYMQGKECGYMNLHNAIGDGNDYQKMKNVNRIEVIDGTGRILVKYLKEDEKPRYSLQDDGRTLKVFIDSVHRMKLKEIEE